MVGIDLFLGQHFTIPCCAAPVYSKDWTFLFQSARSFFFVVVAYSTIKISILWVIHAIFPIVCAIGDVQEQ